MRSFRPLHPIVTSMLVLLAASNAVAQWRLDGVGAFAPGGQTYPLGVSDNAGGAIFALLDDRSGLNDVYAQRVNASGVLQWTEDGVPVCTAADTQGNVKILADGAGGAFMVWTDLRAGGQYDIYAQRVNATGVPQWTANGIAISLAAGNQLSTALVTDGAGGVIIAFDGGGASSDDVYAQRVNAAGVVQWAANGVVISAAPVAQQLPVMVSDGAGGAIIAWRDVRNPGGSYYDIYAQRVNASGVTQWTANGVALCVVTNVQWDPVISSDGSGGAIVAWEDGRNAVNFDVYAQRVNASGVVQWTPDGNSVCTATGDQNHLSIVPDASGGAIIAWWDTRNPAGLDVYAQRVNKAGVLLWQQDGIGVATEPNTQGAQSMIPDGLGGVILSWHDVRSGVGHDVYAQRINANGLSLWTSQGVPVSTAPGDQAWTTTVSDGKGGAIVAWHDGRTGVTDVYAQRIEADFGAWGRPEPNATSANDVPNDQGGKVALNWQASGHDVIPFSDITHYSVWRAIDPVMATSFAVSQAGFTDPSTVGRDFRGHAVFHERIAATDYYWEWVANQNATHDAGYSYAVATRQDAIGGNPATHYFRVLAHTSVANVLYKSNVISGQSVDNLAPAVPLTLIAQRAGSDVQLRWNRVHVPDLRDYSVYRATSSGVTPIPINFLATAEDTIAVDSNAPPSTLYYIVTAYDVHENQSAPSNEASVGPLTGIGNAPAITALTALPNHPNPFASSTELSIGLPSQSDVSIEIYDVTGARVRSFSMSGRPAGWQKIRLAGVDDAGHALASGVYFYRITAAGTTLTRKMVITR